MNKDINRKKSELAVRLVEKREKKSRRAVRKARKGSGYDLVSSDTSSRRRKIEVKGTEKPHLAIPDLAETEFDKTGRQLKATHLYVVANIKQKPRLFIVTRDQLARELARVGGATKLVRWRVPHTVQKKLRDSVKGIPLNQKF